MMSHQSVGQNRVYSQQAASGLPTPTEGGALDRETAASVPALAEARGGGHLILC